MGRPSLLLLPEAHECPHPIRRNLTRRAPAARRPRATPGFFQKRSARAKGSPRSAHQRPRHSEGVAAAVAGRGPSSGLLAAGGGLRGRLVFPAAPPILPLPRSSSSRPNRKAPSTTTRRPRRSSQAFEDTQMAIIKSQMVLNAALRKPEVGPPRGACTRPPIRWHGWRRRSASTTPTDGKSSAFRSIQTTGKRARLSSPRCPPLTSKKSPMKPTSAGRIAWTI